MAFFGKYYFRATYRHGSGEPGQVLESILRPQVEAVPETWQPPTDIYETDGGIVVRVEIAGMEPEAIDLEVDGGLLVIRGRRMEHCARCKKKYDQMEIHYGPFERRLSLPGRFSARGASALYRHGMLEVFLPRMEQEPPREERIRVTAG